MLTSLRLVDFKSFADQTVPLGPLTLLVGANASGKSNLFDGIRFLQGIGLDMPLTEILLGRWEGGHERWPGLRGGAAEAARWESKAFQIESAWATNVFGTGRFLPGRRYEHLIRARCGEYPLVSAERLRNPAGNGYLFDTEAPALRGRTGLTDGGAIRVAVKRSGQGNSPTAEYPASRSLLGQLAVQPPTGAYVDVARRCAGLMELMRNAVFLDISPAEMRNYRPRQAKELGAEGTNISPVLLGYCRDTEGKAELVDWLSELCAPAIQDIRFDVTRLDEVMLSVVEQGGVTISARSLSDGTLRFLGILAALLTAPKGSMLLIEEIENGLHPTRAHLLVELLEQTTRERGVQIIATTHSPLILENLSERTLHDAVVFGRVADREGSLARRLGDLDAYDEIATRRDLDHLFATGWLERAL
jgi:hypothetical protein